MTAQDRQGRATAADALCAGAYDEHGGGDTGTALVAVGGYCRSELAPFLRAAFSKKPKSGYFFRAEFQAHFATMLEERKADPDFWGDPYARYGGRSLHTRSHGEAFLSVLSSWMTPGLILMDEPESALSPQRQLSCLATL